MSRYYVECFNDKWFLKAYGIDSSEIPHNIVQGKKWVLDKLSKEKNKIGIIDLDKGIKHKYFEICNLKEEISNEIQIYNEQANNNIIIVFNRKIETMFVEEIKKSNATDIAEELGFNNSQTNYHNIGSNKRKLNNLKILIENIIPLSEELQTLKQYLK